MLFTLNFFFRGLTSDLFLGSHKSLVESKANPLTDSISVK